MFVIGYLQNESSQQHTQNLTIERQNSYWFLYISLPLLLKVIYNEISHISGSWYSFNMIANLLIMTTFTMTFRMWIYVASSRWKARARWNLSWWSLPKRRRCRAKQSLSSVATASARSPTHWALAASARTRASDSCGRDTAARFSGTTSSSSILQAIISVFHKHAQKDCL